MGGLSLLTIILDGPLFLYLIYLTIPFMVKKLYIDKLIYVFACLIVPIFAYLIVLEAGGTEFLGTIINILLVIAVGYAGYLMYENYRDGQPAAANKIGSILILAVLCAVFWACFEQAGSSLVVWADKCIDLKFMVASQTNAINPGYIIFLALKFIKLLNGSNYNILLNHIDHKIVEIFKSDNKFIYEVTVLDKENFFLNIIGKLKNLYLTDP